MSTHNNSDFHLEISVNRLWCCFRCSESLFIYKLSKSVMKLEQNEFDFLVSKVTPKDKKKL